MESGNLKDTFEDSHVTLEISVKVHHIFRILWNSHHELRSLVNSQDPPGANITGIREF